MISRRLYHLIFISGIVIVAYVAPTCNAADSFFKNKDIDVCDSHDCQAKNEEQSVPADSDITDRGMPKKRTEEHVNIVITFYNAVSNHKLIQTFTVTVKSLLEHASVPLVIHILGDKKSQDLATRIIQENSGTNHMYKVMCDFYISRVSLFHISIFLKIYDCYFSVYFVCRVTKVHLKMQTLF